MRKLLFSGESMPRSGFRVPKFKRHVRDELQSLGSMESWSFLSREKTIRACKSEDSSGKWWSRWSLLCSGSMTRWKGEELGGNMDFKVPGRGLDQWQKGPLEGPICPLTLPMQPAVETWKRWGEEATASAIPEKAESNWIFPNSNILGDKVWGPSWNMSCSCSAERLWSKETHTARDSVHQRTVQRGWSASTLEVAALV